MARIGDVNLKTVADLSAVLLWAIAVILTGVSLSVEWSVVKASGSSRVEILLDAKRLCDRVGCFNFNGFPACKNAGDEVTPLLILSIVFGGLALLSGLGRIFTPFGKSPLAIFGRPIVMVGLLFLQALFVIICTPVWNANCHNALVDQFPNQAERGEGTRLAIAASVLVSIVTAYFAVIFRVGPCWRARKKAPVAGARGAV